MATECEGRRLSGCPPQDGFRSPAHALLRAVECSSRTAFSSRGRERPQPAISVLVHDGTTLRGGSCKNVQARCRCEDSATSSVAVSQDWYGRHAGGYRASCEGSRGSEVRREAGRASAGHPSRAPRKTAVPDAKGMGRGVPGAHEVRERGRPQPSAGAGRGLRRQERVRRASQGDRRPEGRRRGAGRRDQFARRRQGHQPRSHSARAGERCGPARGRASRARGVRRPQDARGDSRRVRQL